MDEKPLKTVKKKFYLKTDSSGWNFTFSIGQPIQWRIFFFWKILYFELEMRFAFP